LWNYIKKQFGNWDKFSKTMPLVYKILMLGLIIFMLFIVITKTQLYQLFYSDKAIETPDYSFSNTGDQYIDYDAAIRQQLEQQQFRLATRLLYLKVINLLRLKEIIHFSKEKTNVDYSHDLTNDDLKTRFLVITSIYNHVWYGDVEIAEEQFLRFNERFQSFYTAIDVKE